MANFDFTLSQGSKLYKGDTVNHNDNNKHSWFSEFRDTASKYGSFVYTFETNKDLKLINISSPLFHYDFIGKVNLHYRDCKGKDVRKHLCLMPLGLPTTKQSRRILAAIGVDDTIGNYKDNDEELNSWLSYYNNKHRVSVIVNNVNYDNYFIQALKEIYIEYDGYIQPIEAPTAIFGGKYNYDEICIFYPKDNISLIRDGQIKIHNKGGGESKYNLNQNIIVDSKYNLDKVLLKWKKEINKSKKHDNILLRNTEFDSK